MFARGVSAKSNLQVHEFWGKDRELTPCPKAMSRNRLSEIFWFYRFGHKSEQSERIETDKFALCLVVWNKFIEKSIARNSHGGFITLINSFF